MLLNQVVDIKPLLLPSNDGNNNNNDGGGKKVYVAELFHGPSLAFKDLGMQVRCIVSRVCVWRVYGAAVVWCV